MLRALPLFCLAAMLSSSAQQSPVVVPDGTAPADWHSLPPTFMLTPAGPGARTGRVWIRKSPDGLLIAGHADGPAPGFSANAADLMSHEHVEIWLAVEPNPEMPVMGWGNQFGDTNLPKGEVSCSESQNPNGDKLDQQTVDECQIWARKQKSYRVYLKRMFARQWQLAPQVGVESFAAPAYQEIEKIFAGSTDQDAVVLPKSLKPEGAPELKVKLDPGAGYDFETLVPWNVFPPADGNDLQQLYLMVEVFGSALPAKRPGLTLRLLLDAAMPRFPPTAEFNSRSQSHIRSRPAATRPRA